MTSQHRSPVPGEVRNLKREPFKRGLFGPTSADRGQIEGDLAAALAGCAGSPGEVSISKREFVKSSLVGAIPRIGGGFEGVFAVVSSGLARPRCLGNGLRGPWAGRFGETGLISRGARRGFRGVFSKRGPSGRKRPFWETVLAPKNGKGTAKNFLSAPAAAAAAQQLCREGVGLLWVGVKSFPLLRKES